MNKLLLSTIALSSAASAAFAGGVERSNQSVAVLFEEGRYLQFGASTIRPDVSGVGGLVTTGAQSGNMAGSYLSFSAAYKADLNNTWSYAVIYDQPYGADVSYPTVVNGAPSTYFAAGSTAELRSHALTGIVQYNLASNASVYAGVRAQTLQAEANVPFIAILSGAPYSASGERNAAFGYLVGAAYEKPEIALRVALTYNSAITHDLVTTESSALGAANVSTTEIKTPQSVNLEFQSGIAEDTLLFGSIRWAEWSEFDITPADYNVVTGGGSLVSYEDDRITYTLGLGRRLNENWAVAGQVFYEEHTGSPTGNLGPTDGQMGVGLAATYTKDNMKITGGVTYVDIGDANTRVATFVPGGIFEDNSAWGAGIRVGYSF